MRAALLVEVKQPFVVEDIDYHAPSPGRVLIKTGAAPFCSTDCVNWRGELFKIPPEDYKRFMNFLQKHECLIPFQGFRVVPGKRDRIPQHSEEERRASIL